MNQINLDTANTTTTIDRNVYGHFSEHLGRCIYEGYWVGEDSAIPNVRGIRKDVVQALKAAKVPVLRWPGGCFADEYHWMDGIGPREARPRMINTHWGGVVENNHFGTHEFMDLCEQVGCEPYICGNVGSGTVDEMSKWVEYLTFAGDSPMARLRAQNGHEAAWKLKYFGVGNENWGCGGNMLPEYYADLYRRYALYARSYERPLFKIGCGPRNDDYHWTDVMMDRAGRSRNDRGLMMDGLALHYYTNLKRNPDGTRSGSATEFDEPEWIEILAKSRFMDELISKHGAIMDKYDPEKNVALVVDEWGTWFAVEPDTHPRFLYQQSTMRDALVAAITLDIFAKHADRVRMANLAQTVNVLQALILTENDRMLLTPTYHVFRMYSVHQGAQLVPAEVVAEDYALGDYSMPAISCTASVADEGHLNITLSNADPHRNQPVTIHADGFGARTVGTESLTAKSMTAHNTFENPETVKPGRGVQAKAAGTTIEVDVPPMSVIVLHAER